MTTDLFVLARAVHFGACLLLFGWIAFGLAVAMPVRNPALVDFWRQGLRHCEWILLPIILVSGAVWFALVAVNMSGGPLGMDVLKAVWVQTQFGIVWQYRFVFWLVAMVIVIVSLFVKRVVPFQNLLSWLQFCLAACLLGSLAWAGHGRESSGWHLLADILHLLVAGVWPAGLLPLFLLLRYLRQSADTTQIPLTIPLIRQFSITSIISVTLLSATGLVNSWYLVGSPSHLLSQPYGRWLLLKVCLFLVAVAIGAVNLLYLRSRLSSPSTFPSAAAQIRLNVLIELILATAVIIVVAMLGILPPAVGP